MELGNRAWYQRLVKQKQCTVELDFSFLETPFALLWTQRIRYWPCHLIHRLKRELCCARLGSKGKPLRSCESDWRGQVWRTPQASFDRSINYFVGSTCSQSSITYRCNQITDWIMRLCIGLICSISICNTFLLLLHDCISRLFLTTVEPIIPRRIIQTYSEYGERWDANLSFKRLNPNYEYLFFNDTEAEDFVRKHMTPDVIRAYGQMPKPVLKADYFRYIAVYVLGGAYSDFDTECLRPIDTWHQNQRDVGFIVGIEAESDTWKRDFARPLQICQWTFAAVPRHPILRRVIEKIANRTTEMLNRTITTDVVMNWTGPGIWTDTIFDYLNETYQVPWPTLRKLEHGRLIGDVYILPITAVQPYAYSMGAQGPDHPDAITNHHFWGTWKRNRSSSTTEEYNIWYSRWELSASSPSLWFFHWN